jgi:SAM-dependent methyltransferase
MYRRITQGGSDMGIFWNKEIKLKQPGISEIDRCLSIIRDDNCERYAEHSAAYTWITENMNIFRAVQPQDKKVLAVCAGGGDSSLFFRAAGAQSVDAFDVSLFPKYAAELKYAALRRFNREQFLKFYRIDDFDFAQESGQLFAPSGYRKLRNDLSADARHLFDKCAKSSDLCSKILSPFGKYRLEENEYLQDSDGYEILRRAAMDGNPNFIWSDLNELPHHLSDSYDIIYLSNIHALMCHDTKRKVAELRALKRHLNPGGIIMANYFYSVVENSWSRDFAKSIRIYGDMNGKMGQYAPYKNERYGMMEEFMRLFLDMRAYDIQVILDKENLK